MTLSRLFHSQQLNIKDQICIGRNNSSGATGANVYGYYMFHGGQISLKVALGVALLSTLIGVVIGALAANNLYLRRRLSAPASA